MTYLFLVLATATIFFRPGEIFPSIRGTEFYFYFIFPCLIFSVEPMLKQLSANQISKQPVSVCVYMLILAVFMSNLAHFDISAATDEGWNFIKNIIYYLLVISLVNSTARLRNFMFWLWLFSLTFIMIAVLQHHGIIELSLKQTYDDSYVSATGETIAVKRMAGSGLFGDPNDMCVVILTGSILGAYCLATTKNMLFRLVYLASIAMFGYGLSQTQSRGGFIGLLAGLGIMLLNYYGIKKGAMAFLLGLPALLAVMKGRLTSISTNEGTAHSRIGLWSDGLMYFRENPLFGLGAGKLHFVSTHVSHNAYVHAYAEMGLFGGSLFLGAFFLPFGLSLRPKNW